MITAPETMRLEEEIRQLRDEVAQLRDELASEREPDVGADAQSQAPLYVNYGGVLTGPYVGPGRYVLIDHDVPSVVEQGVGATPPSPIHGNQVWIDKAITFGCHFFRAGG